MPRIPVPRSLMSILLTAALAGSAIAQANAADELDVVRCWASPAGAPVGRIASDNTRLYAASDGARLSALSLDGKNVWSAEFGGEVVSNVLVADDLIYLVTNAAGDVGKSLLRLVSRDTGIVAGTIDLPRADRHFISSVAGGMIVASANGVVHEMSGKGDIKWRREIAAGLAGVPAFSADKVYVASTSKQVFTIRLSTGEIETVEKMPFFITAVGVTPSGVLIVGDERGNLTALSAGGRRNWRFRTGARVSRIMAENGHVLALSDDNFVYLMDVSNGSVRWKRRLGGRAVHSATINGTYALTTSIDEHGAVLSGLDHGRAAGRIALDADEFVSADPVVAGGLVLVGTNTSIYGYSLTGAAGCPK